MQRNKSIHPTDLALECIAGRISAYPVEIYVYSGKKDCEILLVDSIVVGRLWALARQQ